jgi:hypothetical protein
MRARTFAGLAWPGVQAWGLDCAHSPKTRPMRARVFGLCRYKSPSRPYKVITGSKPSLKTGWPDWTNFRPFGATVFYLKIINVTKIFGPFYTIKYM